jgi:hypothetical protein
MTSSDQPTVLIIDDDSRMRAGMQRLLKTVGCIPSRSPLRKISCGTSFQMVLVASCLVCDSLE